MYVKIKNYCVIGVCDGYTGVGNVHMPTLVHVEAGVCKESSSVDNHLILRHSLSTNQKLTSACSVLLRSSCVCTPVLALHTRVAVPSF